MYFSTSNRSTVLILLNKNPLAVVAMHKQKAVAIKVFILELVVGCRRFLFGGVVTALMSEDLSNDDFQMNL